MGSELNISFFIVGCSSKSASKCPVCGFQIRLLSMLEEYNILRQEKEQERRRQRVMSSIFTLVQHFCVCIIQEIDVSYY